jgi:hypothetical protein
VRDHIVDAGVRGIVSIAFRFGFRKEELENFLCRQVKFAEKSIHLFQGTTKNSQPRKVVLDSASLEEIKEAAKGKGPDDYVFTWTTGNKKGKRIRDFRTSWNTACCCFTIFAAARFVEWFDVVCHHSLRGVSQDI